MRPTDQQTRHCHQEQKRRPGCLLIKISIPKDWSTPVISDEKQSKEKDVAEIEVKRNKGNGSYNSTSGYRSPVFCKKGMEKYTQILDNIRI